MQKPSVRARYVEALIREIRLELAADGFDRPVGLDPVEEGGGIVGCVVISANAAGEEAVERLVYPRRYRCERCRDTGRVRGFGCRRDRRLGARRVPVELDCPWCGNG